MSGSAGEEPAGKRPYRHRGPRRATGGDTDGQGEPQWLAGFSRDEAGSRRSVGSSSSEAPDARERWLREQRPPHWG